MSLVEATIILSVLALLTAVLAPSINDFANDAKRTKAAGDVQTIGSAIARMLKDTGETMVLVSGAVVGGAGPSHALANRITMLVGDGLVPTVSGGAVGTSTTNWNSLTTDVSPKIVETIASVLIDNTPGYRAEATMTVATNFDPSTGQTYNSEFAWRGSYLSGPVGADPWGTRYAVNTEFLGFISGATQTQIDKDVFVLCTGPNGIAQTSFAGDTTSPGGDDIIYVVSGAVQ